MHTNLDFYPFVIFSYYVIVIVLPYGGMGRAKAKEL